MFVAVISTTEEGILSEGLTLGEDVPLEISLQEFERRRGGAAQAVIELGIGGDGSGEKEKETKKKR